MVHLITKANSVALLLFHVEHFPGSEWFWRWRPLGDFPPAYLAWREGSACEPRVIQHCEIPGCRVEAQWRLSSSAPWSQAALREPALGTAPFRVFARKHFHAPRGFRAFAEVAGMIACYQFAPLELHPGVETTVPGRADGPYADNLLFAPGEFVSEDAMVRIENSAASADSLAVPLDDQAVLCIAPGSAARKFFVHRPAASHGIADIKPVLSTLK